MRDDSTIEETIRFMPAFNADGLLPCVTVDARTGAVLMAAWMNRAALDLTLESGMAHYWSRSRQTLWKKGATSGALQHVVSARVDCDQDTVLLSVTMENPQDTCHTGRETCFYRRIVAGTSGPELEFVDTG